MTSHEEGSQEEWPEEKPGFSEEISELFQRASHAAFIHHRDLGHYPMISSNNRLVRVAPDGTEHFVKMGRSRHKVVRGHKFKIT